MVRGAGRCSASLPERPRRWRRPLHPVRGGIPYGTTSLIKMARQLDALDEASLLALWDKYAVIVSTFRTHGVGEEAGFFRSFRPSGGKNQLFNYSWSAQVHPGAASQPVAEPDFFWTRQRVGPAPAKPKRKSRDYPVPPAPQSREGCLKSPAEKAEAAGKPFFRPIHVDDPAEPL